MLPLGTIADPEIVIGLVGRIGLDTRLISERIQKTLLRYNYSAERIKVTSLIPSGSDFSNVRDHPVEDYYTSRIDACNALRRVSERNDILACLAVMRIRDIRAAANSGDEDKPLHRKAFIIDQIKRPEESDLLRQIYRDLYIQISCHAPRAFRENQLAVKIARSHPEKPRADDWRSTASGLIARDDAEEDNPTGQQVREVFPLADLIIDASADSQVEGQLERFFEVFFGRPIRSPTLAEHGMALASATSFRSIDMSRQVGAAILSAEGEIVALGCNEVPKAGGGIYSEGDAKDARDAALGEDQNTSKKRLMVTDVVRRLAKAGLADKRFDELNIEAIEEELIDKDGAPLKNCLVLDTLEYGRMLHAEMCSIAEAARRGASVNGCVLYCTTFPCHNCAKHIVGVGITSLYYLQPYPKSQVSELYPDSIDVDSEATLNTKVPFRQFIGITPIRYYLFEKRKLKDQYGRIKHWDHALANPISRQVIPIQSDSEKYAIYSLRSALEKIKIAVHPEEGASVQPQNSQKA
jgi:deoxycytidylate deaminase